MENRQPAVIITAPLDGPRSRARTVRPANEVLDEVTWLTHLDTYRVRDGVVAAFDDDDLDTTPREREGLGSNSRDMRLWRVLSQIADLVRAYNLLHSQLELRSKAMTMFVQEVERPGVARLVEVGEGVWRYIHGLVPIIQEGSHSGLWIARRVINALLMKFGVRAKTPAHLRSAQWQDVFDLKLRYLHFVYALALVSSMKSHAIDFNWQFWDEPVKYFKINESLTFRKYDIGSMGEYLGPVWILAKKTTFLLPNDGPSDSRSGRIDSGTEHESAGLDLPYLSARFANQELDGPTNTSTEAEMSTTEISKNTSNDPERPSFTFQISVSIPQLRELWNANIEFAEAEQMLDRESIEAGTMQETRTAAIKILEVGSGVVLPIGRPTLMNTEVEVVCGWYSLDPEGNGNMMAMADIIRDGEVELCDSDTLLII
ncbi:Malonamoyl-CoA synthetase [Venturia nashicola]|nr:Malonamoyl-CoA synthetase [Venturia nashicola]